MKTCLLTLVAATQIFVTQASAEVNGTYRVSGSENQNGEKSTFTGSVKVTNYRKGSYNLRFAADGGSYNSTFTLNFNKPLKETTESQTVIASNSMGTSSTTFFKKNGKMHVKFTYKSNNGSVRGHGSGSK